MKSAGVMVSKSNNLIRQVSESNFHAKDERIFSFQVKGPNTIRLLRDFNIGNEDHGKLMHRSNQKNLSELIEAAGLLFQ